LLSIAKVANSPILERRIEETTAGLPSSFAKHLCSTGEDNAATIVEYIAAVENEVNLSDNYRRDLIESLARFSKYNDNKPFKVLTRSNVIAFLESLHKTETGSYAQMDRYLQPFPDLFTAIFQVALYPDFEPNKRPKPTIVENLARLKRKEESIYKPSDLWTQQDDLLFLKYCPSKRDKCYHACLGTCHVALMRFLN
jgi:hypothetical protein